jgi:hypothetical protein
MSETPQYPTTYQTAPKPEPTPDPAAQTYELRPPKLAAHGPWKVSTMSPHQRMAFKDAALAKINAGDCECHMCKRAGSPQPTPPSYWWARQPTPRQKSTKQAQYALSYLNDWPLWLLNPARMGG